MKHVTFLIADGVINPGCLFSAIEVFETANAFHQAKENEPYYHVRLAGATLQQQVVNSIFTLQVAPLDDPATTANSTATATATADPAATATTATTAANPAHTAEPELIILPSYGEQDDFAIRKNPEVIDWIVRQYAKGAEVASLCTGTFLLAAIGLLEGKVCATHWKAEAHFRQLFPELDLHTSKIVTDQQGIYTAGGAVSSLNLALYIVEKYSGREAALYCARILQIDIDRNSQSQFILFDGLKDHKDDTIRTMQNFIEQHVGDRLTVDQLATQCAMDRINFSRRFKRATRLAPADYIQRIKMEAAKRKFESTGKNISEVMYEVGYVDVKAFRNIFKKVVGLTPSEYKTKFNQRDLPQGPPPQGLI
ncbi:MAG TPA: helix-turn-helix domain-containing protein [Puia sp.]|nr:helix-turn-helix domain-containing protein [Puia sp.]